MEFTAALCDAVSAGRSLEKSRGAFSGVSELASTLDRFTTLTNPAFMSTVNGARVATAAFFKSSRNSMGRSSGGVSRNTCKILLCATDRRIGLGVADEIVSARLPGSASEFFVRFAPPRGVATPDALRASAPKSV